MENTDFKVGDIVSLNSAGYPMTIVAIHSNYNSYPGKECAECMFMVNDKYETVIIPLAALTK